MLQKGVGLTIGVDRQSSLLSGHAHAACSSCTPSRLLARSNLAKLSPARRPTSTASTSSASVSTAEPHERAAGVISVLRQLRGPTLCLAGCALWAFLSSGQPLSPAFCSSTMAVSHHTAGGVSLAAQSAGAGLAAGVLHTLCGPDHLAGLAPLSIGRTRTMACALGALWGFGHSTGQLILGVAFALLKDRFEDFTPMITKWSGIIVPLTLMLIGFMGIYESKFAPKEEEEHTGINLEGTHEGDLALAGGGASARSKGRRIGMATYFTGIVHGLSPDALVVVIPALALPTQLASICYISLFVVGTVVSMGAYTLLLGSTTNALAKDKPWLQSHLSTLASVIAISVGVLMLLAEFGLNVPLFS